MNNMSNYPPGAENDPNAPYNQLPEKYKICEECDGSGQLENADHTEACPICYGYGEVLRTFEDDLADEEAAAEEKGDRIRNESHF